MEVTIFIWKIIITLETASTSELENELATVEPGRHLAPGPPVTGSPLLHLQGNINLLMYQASLFYDPFLSWFYSGKLHSSSSKNVTILEGNGQLRVKMWIFFFFFSQRKVIQKHFLTHSKPLHGWNELVNTSWKVEEL